MLCNKLSKLKQNSEPLGPFKLNMPRCNIQRGGNQQTVLVNISMESITDKNVESNSIFIKDKQTVAHQPLLCGLIARI